MPHRILVILFFALSVPAWSSEWVEITQKSSGKSLPVKVHSIVDGKITFEIKSGKKFTSPTASFTSDSLANADKYLKAKNSEVDQTLSAINTAISHPLFDTNLPLWEQSATDVAKRLKWPNESTSAQSSSYRYYPPKTYTFLGTHPYSAVLYGDAVGNPSHLSLVFANKGDYGSKLGMGEDHFKKIHPDEVLPASLNDAIELDANIITQTLTKALGESVEQYYGEKEDKRRVLRWDYGEHSFILSEEDLEYTSLLVVPKPIADNEGKVDFVKDSDLRNVVAANVVNEENGDTVIKNIPMVNQGPKGYCAPATFERAMRYMLVPADMYLLATAATQPEGGTNTSLLADSAKRIIRSKARRIKDLDLKKDLKIRTVKKYIDKGVPVLWQMRSLDEYNKIANKRTKERESITDFSAWAETTSEEAEQLRESFELNYTNHHICLIIGYNEATNEIAVSDSWGPRYALRWVNIDIAQAVTNPGGFVIDL
ncbi:C39 family peptidase [Rubritalea sp.]|uniref:C39 family peptidase n=1 Tax=Rubritalea sp. TaxID=2109375 RepID=UPI003EF29936